MESKFNLNKGQLKTPPVSNQAFAGAPAEAVPPQPLADNNISQASGHTFIAWLKEDWLLKLGGFLLLIGFGWLTTYAFMNDWIGPVGRITLGILAGVVILGLGTWRIKKYINQGGIFLVLGSTVILLTVFAGQIMYGMFPSSVALIIMFLSAAFVALMSVKYDSFAVALSGLILSVIAPLLTHGSGNDFALFSYLLVIVLGTVWIVSIQKNWGSLIFASLISVGLYSIPYLSNSNHYKSESYLLVFAYVFTGVFFLTSVANILKSNREDIKSFLVVAVANGIFVLTWIMSFVGEEWQSLSIIAWMLAFIIGAFILFRFTQIKECFYVYAGVAVAMLATATAIELDGAALTIAYIIEGALIPIIIYLTTRDYKASATSSLVLFIPLILSLENLSHYFNSAEVFSSDFFVLLLMIAVLLGLGVTYKKLKMLHGATSPLDAVLLVVGSAYAYITLWVMLHIGIADDASATTLTLIIFTIIGLVKYFRGIAIGSRVLRNYGGLFLGFVVLRLIFIDIWDMDMAARIVVFFLVGILLISTAFIGKKIKSGFTEATNN